MKTCNIYLDRGHCTILETHIVKYVLVISCMSVKVVGLVCAAIFFNILRIKLNEMLLTEMMKYKKEYTNCDFEHRLWKLLFTPQLIWFQNIAFNTILLWFVLISILTRYLAARYLNHPFNKTLYRYTYSMYIYYIQFYVVAFLYSPSLLSLYSP